MELKPPTPGGVMAASDPPASITSAFPNRIRFNASTNECADDAQAETVV